MQFCRKDLVIIFLCVICLDTLIPCFSYTEDKRYVYFVVILFIIVEDIS